MKKGLQKTINLFLSVMMVITCVSVMMPNVSAANYTCTKSLEELETMFPADRYWNHVGLQNWDMTTTTDKPCTSTHRHGYCYFNGSCGCNSYKGKAIQCMGFAYTLQDLAFGGFDGHAAGTNKNYMNAMANLKPGDVICYWNKGIEHSIFVTKVDGDNITFMDCNGTGGGCIIRHDVLITKSGLKDVFKYVSHAPVELISNSANRVNLYQTATVTAISGIKIRQLPDINSAQVGYVASGAAVNIYNYPIQDSSGYTWRRLLDGRGWVCESYLHIISGQFMASGTYKIQAANGKYLSYVRNPQNDVNIVMYEDLANTELANLQLWNFQPLAYFGDSGDIYYRITPVLNAGYSLDCDSTNNEALHLWETLDIAAQQWIIGVRADGSLKIVNNGNRFVLDIGGYSNENNAEVITYSDHGGTNQMFYLAAQ